MKNKSIFATATITKNSENQDSKGQISTDLFNAVLVADGLGTYKYARQASCSVVESLLKALENTKDISLLDFEKKFKTAKKELVDLSENKKTEEDKDVEFLYGTTAITFVETEKAINVGYVGNGAIWHIRGNFDEFPSVFPFPWNAVNFLNPHSFPNEYNKEALYRLISDDKDDYGECIPTEFEIKKDCQQGDIFMICTDGIYSEDQRFFGTNSKGIWVKYEKTMQKFFEHLKLFFKKNSDYTNENLGMALNHYLEDVKPDLDDDATLGVLITENALNYQRAKKQVFVNENNTDKQVQE